MFTQKQKRSLFLGLAVIIFGILAWFVFSGNAGATNDWELTNTEYGDCIPNDAYDCENYGGTQTITKYYEKYGLVCPEGYHPFVGSLCEKDGPQFDLKSKVLSVVDTKTEVEYKDCEVVPPPCEEEEECPEGTHSVFFGNNQEYEVPVCEPDVPPSVHPSDERFAGSSTEPPAPRVCTVWHESPTVWYENNEFKWATDENGIQKFSLIYGPSENELVYGIDNLPSDSRGVTIERPAWNQTWFQVWSWIDNCAFKSMTIDP